MVPIDVEFGRTVRALREAADYSQEGFADAIGITRTYMGKIERGGAHPTLPIIGKIAEGLKISLSKLFAEMEKNSLVPR